MEWERRVCSDNEKGLFIILKQPQLDFVTKGYGAKGGNAREGHPCGIHRSYTTPRGLRALILRSKTSMVICRSAGSRDPVN